MKTKLNTLKKKLQKRSWFSLKLAVLTLFPYLTTAVLSFATANIGPDFWKLHGIIFTGLIVLNIGMADFYNRNRNLNRN